MVLDAEATPFTRIWCAFEESIAVTMDNAARPGKGHFLLDIATVPSGNPETHSDNKAELLTDGLSPVEQEMEVERQKQGFGDSGWLAKSNREQRFPIVVIHAALQKFTVVKAEASKKEDRTNILNSIVGRKSAELHLEPLVTHPRYDEVDDTLKSIFAEAAIRKAVAEELELNPLTTALRKGTARKALRFTFSELESTFGAAHLQALSESFPEKLESLDAAFSRCKQLADVAALGAGLEKLQALTSLNLNFRGCAQLHSDLQTGFRSKVEFVEALGA